jgi:hypothetical protein
LPGGGGTVSPTFAVGTELAELDPLPLPPAGGAAEEGAPSTEAADACWALLEAALPIFHSRKDRRSAAQAARHWASPSKWTKNNG